MESKEHCRGTSVSCDEGVTVMFFTKWMFAFIRFLVNHCSP